MLGHVAWQTVALGIDGSGVGWGWCAKVKRDVPDPPARFSHDSNIFSQNVTDGVSYLRYLMQQ